MVGTLSTPFVSPLTVVVPSDSDEREPLLEGARINASYSTFALQTENRGLHSGDPRIAEDNDEDGDEEPLTGV